MNLNKSDSASVYFQKSIDTKANNFSDIYLDANLKLSLLKKQEFDEDYFNRMLRQPRNLMASSKINYYTQKGKVQQMVLLSQSYELIFSNTV